MVAPALRVRDEPAARERVDVVLENAADADFDFDHGVAMAAWAADEGIASLPRSTPSPEEPPSEPGEVEMSVARSVSDRPAPEFPKWKWSSEPGSLIEWLMIGRGVVWVDFGVFQKEVETDFPAWLEEYRRFTADPSLAEKAIVKFSQNLEALKRGSKPDTRDVFDVKQKVLENTDSKYDFFRSMYRRCGPLIDRIRQEFGVVAKDAGLAKSGMKSSILRHNCYPSNGELSEHSDYGIATFIEANADALEVNLGGDWYRVPGRGCLVIAGDVAAHLTRGLIPAVQHRAKLAGCGSRAGIVRQSANLYVQPSLDDIVQCSQDFLSWATSKNFRLPDPSVLPELGPLRYGDHHKGKVAEAFGKAA